MAYVALRPYLVWAKKAARGVPVLQPWELPVEMPRDAVDRARALIGAAVLAPSTWNTQPWSFEVEEHAMRLVADTRRALPVIDPAQKSMMISLGAALENLLIAARAYGLRPTVNYFPRGVGNPVVAEVQWTDGETRRDRGLFHAIPDRRTNRREYDGRGIFPQNRAQLLAQVSERCRVHWMDGRDEIKKLGELAQDAVEARVGDRRCEAEQRTWMRFGDDDARKRGDGVTIDQLEIGGPAKWFAGRYFDPDSGFLKFGAQAAGKQAREAIRSAGAVALITCTTPGETAWLGGGQVYERFALKATQLGIAQQPINEPIDLDRFRPEVLRRFDAVGEEPLMLVRLGHAKRPNPAPRRSVAIVSSFRAS
jgi:nitroreductase